MEPLFKYRYIFLQVIFFVGFSLGPYSTAMAATTGSCYTDTFQVPASKGKAVDVLFVVETSPSMSDLREKIARGLSDFVVRLPANSDFNVAVMASHGSTSQFSGKLYRVESEPLVLKSSQLSPAEIQGHLELKLMQLPVDAESGGGEEGLFSLFNSLSNPALLSEIQAADFFRTNAALSVVFIADRRDICAVTPAGIPEETDPVKIAARIRDCEGMTAAGLTNRLALLKASMPLQVSGIIYTDSAAPEGKEIGYGYTDMIRLNGGAAIDIGRDDIGAGLAPLLALGGQAGQSIFHLSHANIDSSTLKVSVDGQEVAFTQDASTITTLISAPEGASVALSYCTNNENPYVDSCEVFANADKWEDWTPAPSTVDLEIKNKSGNVSLGALRNLRIQKRSGQLSVDSAMAVSSILSVSGGHYLRLTGDIGTISNVTGSFRIDKAGHVGEVSETKGSFQLNSATLRSYTKGSGNACIRAGSIGKIQSMSGTKIFITSEIGEMSDIKDTVHVYGAVIRSVTDVTGIVCLHNGAKVLNSSNVSGFIGECP